MRSPEKFEPKAERGTVATAEKQEELGKEAERTIAEPLFRELKDIFPEVEHTTEEIDKKGIDFILALANGKHVAVQFSIAESRGIWQKKARKVLEKPLAELKEIHPNPNLLSRNERLEEVPVILIRIHRAAVEEAYSEFKIAGGKGSPFDFLSNKKELKQTVLIQALANLFHFSEEKELSRRFPALCRAARERYDFLNKKINSRPEKPELAVAIK